MTGVVEPLPGTFVLARHPRDRIGGDVYHRDDREGHGDPEEGPQRWWWHDGREWVSWGQVVTDVNARGQVIEPLGYRDPAPLVSLPGEIDTDPAAARESVALAPSRSTHRYLSTGCLHGRHDWCKCATGSVGPKIPGQCKFCAAPCICDCHA